MSVRRLGPGEAGAWRAIRLEGLREAPAAFGTTLADVADAPSSYFAERLSGAAIFVAESGGGIVGSLVLSRERGGNTRHRGILTGAYVRASRRGRGHMTALIAAAEAEARRIGLLQLELHVSAENSAAERVYARAGFVRCGTIPEALRVDGRPIDEHVMVKPLAPR